MAGASRPRYTHTQMKSQSQPQPRASSPAEEGCCYSDGGAALSSLRGRNGAHKQTHKRKRVERPHKTVIKHLRERSFLTPKAFNRDVVGW